MNLQDMLSSSGSLLNPSIMPTIESAKARRNLMIGGVIAAVLVAGGVAYALYRRSKAKKAPSARQSNRRRTSRRAIRRAARKANKASKPAARESSKSARVPSSRYRLKPTMDVQTLIFPKPKYTQETAVAWAKEHDFKSDKVDETGQSFRLRQMDPGRHGPKTFRTIPFGKSGIKAVVAKKKQYKAVA